MAFTEYKSASGRKPYINSVILQAGTYLRFSKSVLKRLNMQSNQRFNVLYDTENKRIALIPNKRGKYKLSPTNSIWVKSIIKIMGVRSGRHEMKDWIDTNGNVILEFKSESVI